MGRPTWPLRGIARLSTGPNNHFSPEVSSSGNAAVWATENTREAIWDAMERKETYAATGPRMIVRFFGGWEFEPSDAHNRLPAAIGYTKGCQIYDVYTPGK